MTHNRISSWGLIILIHFLYCSILFAQNHEDHIFKPALTSFHLTDANISVNKRIHAGFKADTRDGEGRVTVAFTNQSTARFTRVRRFEWDFENDGVIDAVTENPVHTYSQAGVYTVRLTVSDGEMSDTLVHENLVTVAPGGVSHQLTGLEDWLEVAGTVQLGDGDFTMETWLAAHEADQGPHPIILSNRSKYGTGFLLGFHNSWGNVTHKIPFMELQHNNYIHYQNPPNLLDGRWHHMAVVRKGRVLTYFFDGRKAGECRIQGGSDITSKADLRIGGDDLLPGDTSFVGLLKNTRVWNHARTQTQLRSDLVRPQPLNSNGLVFQLEPRHRRNLLEGPLLEGKSFSANIPTTAISR